MAQIQEQATDVGRVMAYEAGQQDERREIVTMLKGAIVAKPAPDDMLTQHTNYVLRCFVERIEQRG